MPASAVHTSCHYCLASRGVQVTVEDNRVRKIAADKLNPHSWQDFCAKGRTAAEVVGLVDGGALASQLRE